MLVRTQGETKLATRGMAGGMRIPPDTLPMAGWLVNVEEGGSRASEHNQGTVLTLMSSSYNSQKELFHRMGMVWEPSLGALATRGVQTGGEI